MDVSERTTRPEDMTPEELDDLREGYIAMRAENLRLVGACHPALAAVRRRELARLRGRRHFRIVTGGLEA